MTISYYELRDLRSVPFHMQMDYKTRNENILSLRPICGWCDGTGNEFCSMYSCCPICGGSGRSAVKGLLTTGE